MEILRLKQEVIKLNKGKTTGKDVFRSSYVGVDTIGIDESLFVVALEKYLGATKGEIQFTDAIVKVEFQEDKDIIDRILTINDAIYTFYMATASDLKKSSCFFIKEEYYEFGQWLKRSATGDVENILVNKPAVTIMKETAYQGFIFSGSQQTNIIPKIVIIEEPKYLYKGKHTVLKGVEKAETIDDIQLIKNEIETILTSHDGQGIMSTRLSKNIADDLGVDYKINWITFRLYAGIGGKGVCTAVDIQQELIRVNQKYGDTEHLKMVDGELMIKDIWNKYHKVSEVDMILNESQCKLVKHFDVDYLDNVFNQIDDIFKYLYVCKYNPKKLRSDRTKLNYQFLQAMNLSYNDLIILSKHDREHLDASLNNIDSLLITCNLADIQSEDYTKDKKANDSFSLMLELLKYDSSLLKDWSVQEHIQKLLKSRIDKISSGKVLLKDASYRTIIQDVQVYINFIATRDMELSRDNTCLQAGEFYSIGRPDKQRTTMGRNPLSSCQELVRFENTKNEYIDTLGYECDSLLVMNCYDATAGRMSGADYDGDIVCSIVDNIIYNSVIELDTPLFFNTFDGAKIDMKYTQENIRLMIKECAGNFIGALALANGGLMNITNEYPYMLKDGTLLSNGEFYSKVKADFKYETSEEINQKMCELLQSGEVIDTMFTDIFTDEQKKDFIRSRHKELRKLQYLILYAQQVSIDASKSGVKLEDNVKKILKEFSEKPYFFRYARGDKAGTTIRNSVIDRYAYECAKHYYTQKFNLMKDVCFSIGDEVKRSKKNVFIEIFERAVINYNQSNVDMIVNELDDIFINYKTIKQGLRNTDRTTKYYKEIHEDNNYRTSIRCNEIYRVCSNGLNDYTMDDLFKAIAKFKLRNDYILQFFSGAIADVVKINNPKVRTFYKGEHPEKDEAKIITIGEHKYTRTFEIIDTNRLGESIQQLRMKQIQKELEKEGNALTIRFKIGASDLNDLECMAVRNQDGYSYRLICGDVVVIDKAYFYKNKTSINDKEKFKVSNLIFNRTLKSNVEYSCKAS